MRLNFSEITVASAGKFKPNLTSDVCFASPLVFCGMVRTTRSFTLALPVESTVAAINRCPEELTTLNCSFNKNEPLRVNNSCKPSAERRGKKPSPVMAKSKALEEKEILPWLNS